MKLFWVVLGVVRWMDCWQNLPEDLREVLSDQVCYATYDTWMSECIAAYQEIRDDSKELHMLVRVT